MCFIRIASYLSLLTDALKSASVTDVPAEKYPLNSPTRLPNTIFIRGSGYIFR